MNHEAALLVDSRTLPSVSDLHAQIFTIDPSGRRIRGLTSSGTNLNPVWSPGGNRIAFFHISRPAEITLETMKPDGSDQREIAQVDAPCRPIEMGLDWSPAGDAFALVELVDNRPWIVPRKLDGSPIRQVTRGEGQLSWQPVP